MWYCGLSYAIFFFFQAEDGIRDLYVTGVQTCALPISLRPHYARWRRLLVLRRELHRRLLPHARRPPLALTLNRIITDRKSTRLNSSHVEISYAVFCLKKKKKKT